jgi:hypothetical protein
VHEAYSEVYQEHQEPKRHFGTAGLQLGVRPASVDDSCVSGVLFKMEWGGCHKLHDANLGACAAPPLR